LISFGTPMRIVVSFAGRLGCLPRDYRVVCRAIRADAHGAFSPGEGALTFGIFAPHSFSGVVAR